MKLEQATLALRPRTLPQCLDLALVMLRAHGIPLLKLWVLVTVPVCTAVYLSVFYGEFTLWLAVWAFCLATVPLGMLLVAAAAPSAFGETPSVRGAFRHLGVGRGILLLFKLLGSRLLATVGVFFFFVPGLLVMTRTGFLTEETVLSRLDNRLYDHRTKDLFKGEMFDLLLRGGLIAIYCSLLVVVLFFTCDLIGSSLSFPILIGRIAYTIDPQYYSGWEMIHAVWLFMTADALVVTTLLAVALAVYPVGRLAWLLCYIDLRVRRDCWDMEVSILNAARRLEDA